MTRPKYNIAIVRATAMKIDDLEEGVEFKERFNARPQVRFAPPLVSTSYVYGANRNKLRDFARAVRVLASTSNLNLVFGRLTVGAAELAVGPSRATAVGMGALFSLAAVHVFSPE
jgi:hypothetical protein